MTDYAKDVLAPVSGALHRDTGGNQVGTRRVPEWLSCHLRDKRLCRQFAVGTGIAAR